MAKRIVPETMNPMDLSLTYHLRNGSKHTRMHRVWNSDLFFQARMSEALQGQMMEAKDAKPSDVIKIEL